MPPPTLPYTYTVATSNAGIYGTFDYPGNVCHLITAGPVLHEFAMASRIETAEVNLFSLPSYNLTTVGALFTGADHRVYFATGDGNHLIVGYNPVSISFDRIFADLSLPQAGYLAGFKSVHQFAVGASINSGIIGALIYVVDMDATPSPALVNSFNVAEHATSIQPGNGKVCGAGSFALAIGIDNLGPLGAALGFGVYVVSPTTNFRTGGLTSLAFDGSASFTGISQPCFDATDGNMLICLQTALGAYLAKVQVSSGALIWKLPIHAVVDLNEATIAHGQLQFIAPDVGPYHWYVIDTVAGAIVSDVLQAGPNFLALAAWSDINLQLVSSSHRGPGSANWFTFGPPQPPASYQGGVIRRG